LNFYSNYLPGITTPSLGANSFTLSVNRISLQVMYSHSILPLSITPPGIFTNNTVLNVNDISGSTFNGTCYFDQVSFSNIPLPVALGYIYDIQLTISYNVTPSQAYAQNYSIPILTSYFNAALTTIPKNKNCTIQGIPSSPIPPLSVTCGPSSV
jgi:hypothetical protein